MKLSALHKGWDSNFWLLFSCQVYIPGKSLIVYLKLQIWWIKVYMLKHIQTTEEHTENVSSNVYKTEELTIL